MKELGDVATTKAKIYKDVRGVEAVSGSVNFADAIFYVTWAGSKILDVDSMEYGKCIKCMNQTFDGSWRYAEKHK